MLNDPALPCFTISEAAHYLRISRALLYTLIRDGRIKTRSSSAPRTIVRVPILTLRTAHR